MILGLDIGNNNLHFSNGYYTKVIPAKVTTENILFNENDTLEFDNKVFTLGVGEFETDYNKAIKGNFIPLLLGAMAMASDEVKNKIVVGVPIGQYESNRQRIRQRILQYRDTEVVFNGVQRRLIIEELEIFPEGISAYYALPQQIRNIECLIIIDVGGRTTDICIYRVVNGKRRIEKSKSIAVGMLNIYSDFINAINSNFTLDKKLEDAEKILKTGLPIYGEKKDLSFTKPIIQGYINEIFKELNLNYPISTEQTVLVGGGSSILGSVFSKRIPNIIILENALTLNVEGLYKVGEKLWLKRD